MTLKPFVCLRCRAVHPKSLGERIMIDFESRYLYSTPLIVRIFMHSHVQYIG